MKYTSLSLGLLACLVTGGCASSSEEAASLETQPDALEQEVIEVVEQVKVEAVEAAQKDVSSEDGAETAERGVTRPEIVSAEAWGSQPDPIPENRLHVPKYVTIHHAGVLWKQGGDATEKVRNLQSWGKTDKDWPDLPYHFLIAPDGTVFEGRAMQYEPETNTNYKVQGHIGVQVYGNFEEQRISPAQMKSLVHLTAWLLDEHGLDTQTIGGHKDRPGADTTCPGRDFDRYLLDGSFVNWVQTQRDGAEPTIDLGAALPDGPAEMIPDAE